MYVGYARVSTQDQTLDLQKDALEAAGCDRIYEDLGVSGSQAERPGLTQALEYVREGDTLVIWRLDRLGRNLKHLISTVEALKERGVHFVSLKESIDTSTATGRLVFHIFCSLAEFERDLTRERVQAGLVAARARGRLGGRPAALSEEQIKVGVALAKDRSLSVKAICEQLGCSRSTYYRQIASR